MDLLVQPPRVLQFLNYLQFERHFSADTSRCYGADLRQFCQFLLGLPAEIMPDDINRNGHSGGPTAVAQLPMPDTTPQHAEELLLNATPDDVRNYLQFMRENSYSKATMARKLATLRSFFKFCNRRSMTWNNPTITIRTPKQEQRRPKFMTEEQILKLLQTPRDTDILGARDKAMLECMYSTGIRVSELVGLNLEDVDIAGSMIRIRNKGRKERLVPLGQTALTALQKYLVMRGDMMKDALPSGPLFANKHGQRLSTRSVRRMLDKYLIETGLDPDISPHTLRHSFATHMLSHGADLRSVQKLLGHKSPNATQIYAHLATTQVKPV